MKGKGFHTVKLKAQRSLHKPYENVVEILKEIKEFNWKTS